MNIILHYIFRVVEKQLDYLGNALKEGNRVQDIFTDLFKYGKTGNDILDKNDSGLFNITDNTKGYPQFVNNSEVN